jgi:hypothetical protein
VGVKNKMVTMTQKQSDFLNDLIADFEEEENDEEE